MDKINDNLWKEIIQKYNDGIKIKELASSYSISQSSINRYFNKNNIPRYKYPSTNKFSKETEELIINLYKKGKNTKEIGLMLGIYNTSVRRVLLRNKSILRDPSKILRYCKHNPFKRNDEYSDYFLGLLLTDGSITKEKKVSRNYGINLSLSEEDSYMIEAFRDWASPNQKITKIYQKINGSYMHSITITNLEAEEWLRRKGNFYSKSYNCKLYIPLNWNILRGIFDGDGGFTTINKNGLRFYICGASKCFIEQIGNFLIKNGINIHYSIKNSNNPLYYVNVYKTEDMIKLGKLMYNNAHISLKRKYEKWLAFYENKRANGINSGKEMAIQPWAKPLIKRKVQRL